MTYKQTIDFLFAATPLFEKQGGSAYKPGLERVLAMAEVIGNPHQAEGIRFIHIGGTNGKGSTSSTLAAVLSASGYRTGLFTSPHLVDFRERIRIDGTPISPEFVVDFVERVHPLVARYSPSFFELTTLMALDYFVHQKVEVAVIEVGMGGRLDSTNIITPDLAVVTNISLDHTQFLGNTLEEIASEKAGIFKRDVPALVGEASEPLRKVFRSRSEAVACPLFLQRIRGSCFGLSPTLKGACSSIHEIMVLCGGSWAVVLNRLTHVRSLRPLIYWCINFFIKYRKRPYVRPLLTL